MTINDYGAVFLNANELFDNIYTGKVKNFKNIYLDEITIDQFNISKDLNRDNFDYLEKYIKPNISLDQFDVGLQNNWFMPEIYRSISFDIPNG